MFWLGEAPCASRGALCLGAFQLYCYRLHKYARRGFAIALPGLQKDNINPALLDGDYVYHRDYDLLLKVLDTTPPRKNNEATVNFSHRTSTLSYNLRQKAHVVTGLPRLLVLDAYPERSRIKFACAPKTHRCSSCHVLRVEEATTSGTVVMTSGGSPGNYFLLWGAIIPNGSDSEADADADDCETYVDDLAGYQCTPLAVCIAEHSQYSYQTAAYHHVCDANVCDTHCIPVTYGRGRIRYLRDLSAATIVRRWSGNHEFRRRRSA